MTGSASAPGTGSEVPIPRTITVFGCVPVMINPPIIALSPVPTRRRVEIFASVAGLGVGVGGDGGVAVAVGVGDGVALQAFGPSTPTVTGVPVLKKPIVAFVASGGLSESNRK